MMQYHVIKLSFSTSPMIRNYHVIMSTSSVVYSPEQANLIILLMGTATRDSNRNFKILRNGLRKPL